MQTYQERDKVKESPLGCGTTMLAEYRLSCFPIMVHKQLKFGQALKKSLGRKVS